MELAEISKIRLRRVRLGRVSVAVTRDVHHPVTAQGFMCVAALRAHCRAQTARYRSAAATIKLHVARARDASTRRLKQGSQTYHARLLGCPRD